jgi:hypothetical protein
VPAQGSSTQVSLVKLDPAPDGKVSLVRRVNLAKRVNLTKRRRRVSLVKRRPAPVRPPVAPPRRRVVPSPTRVFAAATTGATRSAKATRAWAGRPVGRMMLPGLLMAVLVALATTSGAFLPDVTGAAPVPSGPESSEVPSTGPDVPEEGLPDDEKDPDEPLLPGQSLDPSGSAAPGQGTDTLAGWAAPMAVRTEIPLVALEAYALAEVTVARTTPACGLRWTTLAGIGRNESNHGRTGGAALTTDGRSVPAIYGPALNGTAGNKEIKDTDRGQLDGDSTWDRAVGPMQFIPSTWNRYAVDADNSGTADPHDLHDAALAAANYLCAGGRNLATAEGWWAAILAYNNVQTYAQNVFNAANNYGVRSRS